MTEDMQRNGPVGLAQKSYYERAASQPSNPLKRLHRWALLEKLLQAKCIGYVDFALAGRLMDVAGRAEEPLAALICHLSLAARKGHVCVVIAPGRCVPSPQEIWTLESDQEEDLPSVSEEEMEKLSALIQEGALMASPPLSGQVSSTKTSASFPICVDGTRYYLQRLWMLESDVIGSLHQFIDQWSSSLAIPAAPVKTKVEHYISSGRLLPEQGEGILAACSSPLTFITGGPGTGKTHTAGLLLRTLWEALPPEKRRGFKVSLAAPTGKAAANLESSIRSGVAGLEGFPDIKGQTLHQLLGLGARSSVKDFKDISSDFIIVDESSMIDLHLMGKLIHSVKSGAHLVLLGDRHQLASIEAGSLFADLTSYFNVSKSKKTPVVELQTCLRAELRTIIEIADSIKKGAVGEVLSHFSEGREVEGVRFYQFEKEIPPSELQKSLINYVLPQFPVSDGLKSNPDELLRAFSRFRLLTPMRQGALGVDALNQAINHAIEQKYGRKAGRAVPIMVIENDHSLELFNGEVGLLFRQPEGSREKDYALFPSRDAGSEARKISSLLLPRYEMAYCMTVHKSQGSEFEKVLLLLPEGAQLFGREGLYTGITRAKRSLEVWSSPDIIEVMMSRQAFRQSGIAKRLQALPFD